MNWKQFKDALESAGVTDDMKIHAIHVEQDTLLIYPPKVAISPNESVHPIYRSKEFDVW